MVHVIARCTVKEGELENFLNILRDNIPNVLAEDGCIRYEACLDSNGGVGTPPEANTVTILESWKSIDHLKAHLGTPHMAVYRDKVTPLREKQSVTVLDPA